MSDSELELDRRSPDDYMHILIVSGSALYIYPDDMEIWLLSSYIYIVRRIARRSTFQLENHRQANCKL